MREHGFTLRKNGLGIAIEPFSMLTEAQIEFIKANKAQILEAMESGGPANEDAAPFPITIHTPMGGAVTVMARDEAHADWLRRMNPPPPDGFTPIEGRPTPNAPPAPAIPKPVRCRDCIHAQATTHPVMLDCAMKIPAPGSCGPYRRWGDDLHCCGLFEGRASP
jgi:hypothetical protein